MAITSTPSTGSSPDGRGCFKNIIPMPWEYSRRFQFYWFGSSPGISIFQKLPHDSEVLMSSRTTSSQMPNAMDDKFIRLNQYSLVWSGKHLDQNHLPQKSAVLIITYVHSCIYWNSRYLGIRVTHFPHSSRTQGFLETFSAKTRKSPSKAGRAGHLMGSSSQDEADLIKHSLQERYLLSLVWSGSWIIGLSRTSFLGVSL